jgi:GTP-binding protein
MKIQSAEFVISAVQEKDYPSQRLPEVAFVGRSNVGKSSLINALLNRKRLVKVSSTPGRTQTINFFRINQAFYFVDLPGYGYAKVPKSIQKRFGPMIEQFLKKSPDLVYVVQILDARHRPTEMDRLMREYLIYHQIPILTVATKSDKIPQGKRKKQVQEIRRVMNLHEDESIFLYSAMTSLGKREVWKELKSALTERSQHKGDES